MNPDLFWIPGPWRGRLAVATRPRGGDWLDDETSGRRRAGLALVVSLLESEEAAQLDLVQEAGVAKSKGVDFISFPIPDRGVPASMQAALSLLGKIAKVLGAGKNVAVHCRQGIGRSGSIAARVLVTSGIWVEKSSEVVSVSRGQSVQVTTHQLR